MKTDKVKKDKSERIQALERAGWKKGFIGTWSHAGYAVRNLTVMILWTIIHRS